MDHRCGMDYEKMRKNNISLPDLVVDNTVCTPKCTEESVEPKVWGSDHSGKGMQQLSKNIPSSYLSASSPSHGSQPMSLPSSLPESASMEAMKQSDISLLSQKKVASQHLKHPPQYTGEIGELRSICEIPPKYRSIFSNYPSFNVIQSKALDILLYSDRPLVISAPTGSGKTVIFELAIINLLIKLNEMNYRGDFKIVYMAPVKALCAERFHDWQEKFSPLGLKCHEVTGDSYDSSVADLQNYNLVLTTPEKWDSLTRKWKQNKQLVQLVKLFLIDEVHLLNEEKRGPVLEAVVSRMKTIQETLSFSKHSSAQNCEIQIPIRFIAVSATIPNIEDLADWLGDGFLPAEYIKIGEEYRPVKLTKVVLGFPTNTKQNPFLFDMNLNYKLRDLLFKYAEGKPTLIFCSTRKGVTQTAQTLAKEITFHFSAAQTESLMYSANNLLDKKLRDTVLAGVGSHHAGMDANDRHVTEDLFRRLLLPVLVTTSTLAMGVNLPAHLVIVKSTQQYIGGIYQDYSETQLLQMIGRAGRPQFDKTATAIIMTRQQDKERYERLVDGKDLIESTLHRHLAEHLNAEVVLETITEVCIAMNWLRSTFLFVRALKNPVHYGFAKGLSETEITKKLQDLCLYEMNGLASANLMTVMNGLDIRPTDNGRLMASFYLSLETMKIFNKITGMESLNDMILVVASCHEFSELSLRRVEKRVLNELNKIKDRECIRFPIKGVVKDIAMKVNVLTQATFGCLPINDHSLYQDSLKIMRVGERVSRCLTKYLHNAGHYKSLLSGTLLAKCYSSKLWENSIYVTKQLSGIGAAYSNLLASAGKTTFHSILIANPRDLERILNKAPPLGNELKKAVIHLPKYTVEMQLNEAQNEGSMTLRLENIEDVSEFATAGLNHWLTIIIGDNTNKVLHNERLNDNQLLQMDGVVSRCFSIDSSNINEIYGHVISDHWVGIDVDVTVTVAQTGNTPGNVMMKKVIQQYVSKIGLPNPVSDKKEATKTAKPKKLTIVEQIRQRGRQLPELGVKIEAFNINTPTALKQSSLDQFRYTPAKRLKLPTTDAQFINENASVGKALNTQDLINDILTPIYGDEQRGNSGKRVTQILSKDCQPTSYNYERHREYDSVAEINQRSQGVYTPGSEPHNGERPGQFLPHTQSDYKTQEDALDNTKATALDDHTDWETHKDQHHSQHQSPSQYHSTCVSVSERFRICDKRKEFLEVISSDDDDEVQRVKAYQLEEQAMPISAPMESCMKNETDYKCNREGTTFSVHLDGNQLFPTMEKTQPIVRSEPQGCLDKYKCSEFDNPRYKDIDIAKRKEQDFTENYYKIPMQSSTSENLIHEKPLTQNFRKNLLYTSCNRESSNATMNTYFESQSEYLQRMKGHFEEFEVINENGDTNSNNEVFSYSARDHDVMTEDSRPSAFDSGWYGGNDSEAKRYQSSQTVKTQDNQPLEDEHQGQFSMSLDQNNYKRSQDALDNDPESNDQYMTECDDGQFSFDCEDEFSDQDNNLPIESTQFLNNDKLEALKSSSKVPLTILNHELDQNVHESKEDYKCFKNQSRYDAYNSNEDDDQTTNSCRTIVQVEDGQKSQDGLYLQTFEVETQRTVNDARDISDPSGVLTPNEQPENDDDYFIAPTPDQRKATIVKKCKQHNVMHEVEVEQSEPGVVVNDHGRGDECVNDSLQKHSCPMNPMNNQSYNNDSNDVAGLPAKCEFLKDIDVIKNPDCDVKISSTLDLKRTDTVFRDKCEVPKEDDLELDILEGNKKEICCGEYGSSEKRTINEELDLKNGNLFKDPDQLSEISNIPKHYFPIFMSYNEHKDENSPCQQEKLRFKFSAKNYSSNAERYDDVVPKTIFDPSTNDITNASTADNALSKNPQAKLDPKNIPKLAFDLDIDSLLDSIDSAEDSMSESNKKCSLAKVPIRNKIITKSTLDVQKHCKRDWDSSDPLMVLFYDPREKKNVKLAQIHACKASRDHDRNSTVLEAQSSAINVLSAELISSDKKNLKPKELERNNCNSSSKGNKIKSAPQEKLFAYCKGRTGYSTVDTKSSSENVNLKHIAKVPKIPGLSVVKPENVPKQNKPIPTQNLDSKRWESITQAISNSNNKEDCVHQLQCPQQNVPEGNPQMSRENQLLGALNNKNPVPAQKMKSCNNESFKPTTISESRSNVAQQARNVSRNSLDAQNNANLSEVLKSSVQTKPIPMHYSAVSDQQNAHEKSHQAPPLTAIEITNAETHSFRLNQQDQTFDRREMVHSLSNTSALRKVSTYEEVVRVRQTNPTRKRDINPSKTIQQSQQLIQKTFNFHEADQISHRSLHTSNAQRTMHTQLTHSSQDDSINLSALANDYRYEQAQYSSSQSQYPKQNSCYFEETGREKSLENFDKQSKESCRQTFSRNTHLINSSLELLSDVVFSPPSENVVEDGGDFDIEESKFKWLASQNTFTQRSEVDEDIFSSNDSERRNEDNLCYGDDTFGSIKSQCSNRPWNLDSDDNTCNLVDDLKQLGDVSEIENPFAVKKFEYNHTQTPRCISRIHESSASNMMFSQFGEEPNTNSSQDLKKICYEQRVAGKKRSHDIDTKDLGEQKYQSVFEQTQANTFQISPARKRHLERSATRLKSLNVQSAIESNSFCNRTEQQYSISRETRKDFVPLQIELDDKWSRDDQFHQLYESDDFNRREYLNQSNLQERGKVEDYKGENVSFRDSRLDDIGTSTRFHTVEPAMQNRLSENLTASRFHRNPTESYASNAPKVILPQKMFQYCQKKTPGIMDSEFNLSKTKHRRHF